MKDAKSTGIYISIGLVVLCCICIGLLGFFLGKSRADYRAVKEGIDKLSDINKELTGKLESSGITIDSLERENSNLEQSNIDNVKRIEKLSNENKRLAGIVDSIWKTGGEAEVSIDEAIRRLQDSIKLIESIE